MKTIQKTLLFVCLFACAGWAMAQKNYTLVSPNGKLKVDVKVGQTINYSVSHEGDIMLNPSPIAMELSDGQQWGIDAKVASAKTTTVNEVLDAKIYKKAKVNNHYNELNLKFKGNYAIVFRAFDDGVAYRFETSTKKPFEVKAEQVELNFPTDQNTYIPYVNRKYETLETQFFNSFENVYVYNKLSQWDAKRLAFTPVLTEGAKGKKVAILEADLLNYPGMYLQNTDSSNTLKGVFAPYPKTIEQGGHNMLQGVVKSRESYLASYEGATHFPWRALLVSENDKDLLDNDMVYKLATPSSGDYSWVKPGKVAWDWWNAWNLYDVDFESGINNETYKYYIDFASQQGIEYVILDEGWAVNKKADLMQVVPEIDLPALVAHAKSKNVGLILWAGYYAINRDLEGICKHYADMGIKGFKVDFMDRDDQAMVQFHTQLAEIAAKHKLMIDYHGTYKPTGLQRTYPNVINFEGVYGLEQMKWGKEDLVTYDVTMPFIRMLAGPIDYTQGAMRNATKDNYRPVYTEAMSQGTRCRQLAEYVVFESPLNMLCDNPSNYMREPECTKFIATIPTTWDETVALGGEVSKHIAIARRHGEVWYVGALTNWDARELSIDLSFLGNGNFEAEVFKDGVNASRAARDYKKEVISIPANKKINIKMAPGGGYAMKIYKK